MFHFSPSVPCDGQPICSLLNWGYVCGMEGGCRVFTRWGSNCFRFHHFIPSTLTRTPVGIGKGCLLYFIICNKRITCLSPMSQSASQCVPLSLSVCLSVSWFISPSAWSGICHFCLLVHRLLRMALLPSFDTSGYGEERRGGERMLVEDAVAANYLACLIKLLTKQRERAREKERESEREK